MSPDTCGYPSWWLEDEFDEEQWKKDDDKKWSDADDALDEWQDRQLEEGG